MQDLLGIYNNLETLNTLIQYKHSSYTLANIINIAGYADYLSFVDQQAAIITANSNKQPNYRQKFSALF